MTTEEVMDCLQLVRDSLRELYLADSKSIFTPHSPLASHTPDPILLPNLKSLILSTSPPGRLFSQLSLPALRTLVLENAYPYDPDAVHWIQGDFFSFLSRSKCPLEVLELKNTKMKADEFIQCLRLVCDSLRRLCVRDSASVTITEESLNALMIRGSAADDIIFPKLEKLELIGNLSSSTSVIADLFASRVPDAGGTRLKSGIIQFTGNVEAEELEHLKRFGIEDLGVEVLNAQGYSLIGGSRRSNCKLQ